MTSSSDDGFTCWRAKHPVDESDEWCGTCATSKQETPLRYDDYRVLGEPLGSGTYAVVYPAKHKDSDEEVAVKAIKATFSVTQAHDEFRVQVELDHPNIVKVHHAEPVQGYMVMEKVDGESLRRKLERSPGEVIENFEAIVCQLTDALRSAHAKGVVHRDVNPNNILFDQDMNVKLADFGIARTLEGGPVRTAIGTPGYMAPEVSMGEPYDTTADMYSLGATLYHIWAGSPPYGRGSPDAQNLRRQAARHAPLTAVNTDVPELVSEIIEHLLSDRPPRPSAAAIYLHFCKRDKGEPYAYLDDYQDEVNAIYVLQNARRTPLLLLARYATSVEGIVGGMRESDSEYGRKRAESYFVKGFAWLAGLLTRLDLSFTQLVDFKFGDGKCPYCESCPCECAQTAPRTRQEMNGALLARLRVSAGPLGVSGLRQDPERTLASVQEMFAAIYGAPNAKRGLYGVGLDAMSSVSQALDALMRLRPVQKGRQQVDILHLELADLVAWFFALLTLYQSEHDFDFERAFATEYAGKCPVCDRPMCQCHDIDDEDRLVNWRSFP